MQIGSKLYGVKLLKYGVPQGPVLGALHFTICMPPLATIFVKQGVKYQCFADDVKLYISYKKPPIGDTRLKLQQFYSIYLNTLLMADNHLILNVIQP